jgi:hypothetical protein
VRSSTRELAASTDPAALAGVVVAGALTLTLAKGPFGVISTAIGATLLFILLAYDPIYHQERPTLRQHLAFGAAYVLCIYITTGWFYMNPWVRILEDKDLPGDLWRMCVMLAVWVLCTAIATGTRVGLRVRIESRRASGKT